MNTHGFCQKMLPGFGLAVLLIQAGHAQCLRTVPVSSNAGLASALSSAQPGDCIVLANGNYAGFAVTKSGSPASPVTIEAASLGQAFITTGISLITNVSWVTVCGVNFTSPGGAVAVDGTSDNMELGLLGATNCRVTRCIFDPPTNTLPANTFFTYLNGGCLSNRIDHCEFGWYTNSGCHAFRTSGLVAIAGVTAPSDRMPWALGYGPYNPNMARYTWVDHDYFHDHYTPGSNGGETIQLGAIGDTGDYQSLYSLVEYNLFVNCDGDPEIISVKSSDNILRFNTVTNSAAVFSLRAGNHDTVCGNFFLCGGAGGGIKMCERDHEIFNNYVENSDDSNYPLMLESGNLYNVSFSHAMVVRAQIAHNTFVNPGRQVLLEHSGSLPAVDFVFANNLITGSGTLYSEDETSLNPARSQNIIYGYTPGQSGFLVENPQLTGSSPRRLSAASPAINAGNTNYFPYVTDDLDGQPRHLPRDIGADEYYASAPVARAPLTTNQVGPYSVDLELSAAPAAQAVSLGATNVSYPMTVASDSGYTGPVTLTVSGLTPGMSAGFSPATVDGSGSVTLSVTNTGAVPGGIYPFLITATSGLLQSSTTITLQVGRGAANLHWAAGGSGVWDIQNSSNWFNLSGGVTDAFYNGDTVLLDDASGVQTQLTIAAGEAVSPFVVTNNSSTNNFTISGPGGFTGSTKFVKTGGSTLTLNTTNHFGGGILVAGGTLVAGNPYALGGQGGFIILTNGGTLDVNGNNLGMDSVLAAGAGAGGNGAIINSGAAVYPALAVLELAGNTTIGGANRWDLRAANGNLSASLSTSGNACSLTKVGTNFIGIVDVNVDPALANINVTAGTLDIENATTSLGNPAATLTVSANATLELYNTVYETNYPNLNKLVVLNDGAAVLNGSGSNLLLGKITLAGNDTFNAGGTSLTLSNTVAGAGQLIKTGPAILYLAGANNYTGDTLVSNGTVAVTGSLAASPLITLAAGATLNVSGSVTAGSGGISGPAGSTLAMSGGTLQVPVSGSVPNVSVGTLSFGSAGGVISITTLPQFTNLPAQFPLIKYAVESGAFNLTAGRIAGGYAGFLSNNTASATVDLVITTNQPPPPQLTWNGAASAEWDVNVSANWTNTAAALSPVVFQNGNPVAFNDSITNSPVMRTNVDLAAGVVVQPASVLVSNSAVSYQIGGAGGLSGSFSLVKTGAGTLTLASTNNFTGRVLVQNGILRAGCTNALGATNVVTTVTNTGTLDLNGVEQGLRPLVVSGGGFGGAGALVNNGAQQTAAMNMLVLAGDTTLGGTGRWDIRNTAGAASLSTGGQSWSITKVGTNQVSLVGVNPIDPALGNINIEQGTFAIQTSTAQAGSPSGTITVSAGATLDFYTLSTPLTKSIVLQNGANIFNEKGPSYVNGPILLQGMATLNLAFNGTPPSLICSNAITGAGGLILTNGGTLALAGTNTFTGSTLVVTGTLALVSSGCISNGMVLNLSTGGTLDASGRDDTTLTLAGGQELTGTGAVKGSVVIGGGAALSPGNPLGTLTFGNNLTLGGGSQTLMALKKSPVTNSLAQVAGNLACGGTLLLTNLSGVALAAGDSFKLFNAAGYAGAFTNLVPPMPGSGLAWNAAGLVTNGILRVVVASPPQIGATELTSSSFSFAVSGGIANAPVFVLTSTNVALPLSQWTVVATNTFDAGGDLNFTNPYKPTSVQQFYLLQLP